MTYFNPITVRENMTGVIYFASLSCAWLL